MNLQAGSKDGSQKCNMIETINMMWPEQDRKEVKKVESADRLKNTSGVKGQK